MRRLAVLGLVSAGFFAAYLPSNYAPHEANACSGSGPAPAPFATDPSIENADSVTTDTILVVIKPVHSGPVGSAGPGKRPVARVQSQDGQDVPLARNDLNAAETKYYASTAVLRPVAPLAPNTDYTLVIDDVPTLDGSGVPSFAQKKLPFHTGAGPRTYPAITPLEIGTPHVEEMSASGENVCCEATYKGCAKVASCATSTLLSRYVRAFSWTTPTLESLPYGSVVPVVTTDRVADETGWQQTANNAKRPTYVGDGTVEVPLVAGEHACLTLEMTDALTGDKRMSPPLCFDGPNEPLGGPRPDCERILELAGRSGCKATPGLTAALVACPAAGGAGTSGAGGASGAGGTTGVAGTAGTAGQSGATAGSPPSLPVPSSNGPNLNPSATPSSNDGCSLAGPQSGSLSALVGVALVGLAGLARKRRFLA